MNNKISVKCLVFVCMVAMLLSGCRSTKNDMGAADGSILDSQQLTGDHVLGDRFENGTRITGAEVDFSPVYFSYDSFQISPAEIAKVESVANYLRMHKNVKLVVEGHCDERGSREYNVSLGEHRALAIRAYLISLGVDGSTIQTRSYGEEMPANPGHNEAAWRMNRRVAFACYR